MRRNWFIYYSSCNLQVETFDTFSKKFNTTLVPLLLVVVHISAPVEVGFNFLEFVQIINTGSDSVQL